MEQSIGKINIIKVGKANLEPSTETAPMIGITDQIAPTAAIVGSPMALRGFAAPRGNATISVSVKRDRDDAIVWHSDKNGNRYTWVDVVVTEMPTIIDKTGFTHRWIDYRKAHDEETDTWEMIEGAKIDLNRVNGTLTKNWRGDFRPTKVMGAITEYAVDKYDKTLMVADKDTVIEGVSPLGNAYKVTKKGKKHPVIMRQTFAYSRPFANNKIDPKMIPSKESIEEVLMFVPYPKGYMGGPVSVTLSGYRVAIYKKETGIEITASLPSEKRKDGKGYKNKYTDKLGRLAEEVVPVIEYEFMRQTGVVPARRKFNGSCATCSSCKVRMYGQNQEEPGAYCTKGMIESLSLDFHWENELRDYVVLGANIYGLHSESDDDLTCLPGKINMGKDFEDIDIEVPIRRLMVPRDKDGRPVKRKNTAAADCLGNLSLTDGGPRKIHDNRKWVETEMTRKVKLSSILKHNASNAEGMPGYEIPSWFKSTENLQRAVEELTKAVMLIEFGDDLAANNKLFEYAWSIQSKLDNDEIVGSEARIKAQSLYDSLYLEAYNEGRRLKSEAQFFLGEYTVTLPDTLFEDEDIQSVTFSLARFDEDEEGNQHMTYVDTLNETDRLPDMNRVNDLLANVHPIVHKLLFEEALTSEEYSRYSKVVEVFQSMILAESNPRMRKLQKTSDYVKDLFDETACMWFSYDGSSKKPFGIANHVFHNDQEPINTDDVGRFTTGGNVGTGTGHVDSYRFSVAHAVGYVRIKDRDSYLDGAYLAAVEEYSAL